MIGTKLAHYEITSHLGTGGMGEVYQATDSKLGRNVAIKLLPEAFTHDADRAARFEREARVLASLNHPNIAAIYGVEESGGRKFLVMELVPGETLAEHIKRGPLPIDEALPIAKEIAEGLEAAHEKGIVHRDLKPANIKITTQGQVKLLDFGLAKAFAGEADAANLSNSPTLSMAATKAGVILGTAAYMSPEQAKGKEANRTADSWAFGCVLYEMLTGHRAFGGATFAEILGNVMKGEPDWTRLPDSTPAAIHRLLRRCLRKEEKLRLRDMRDVRIELDDVPGDRELKIPSRRSEIRLFPIALIAFALLATFVGWWYLRNPREQPELRVEINTPPTTKQSSFAVSPNGRDLVFVSKFDSKERLYLQSLGLKEPELLPGTEGAGVPFWSPNGQSIGFMSNGVLKRIDVAGRVVQTVANAPPGMPIIAGDEGGTWNEGGTIVFGPNVNAPLYRVSASGGQPVAATHLDPPRQTDHSFPRFLPDGQHFLLYARGNAEGRGVYVGSLQSPEVRRLFDADGPAVFVPSGYLLFVRGGALLAQRFDTRKFEPAGNPVTVAPQATFVSASANVIAYRVLTPSILTWFDRSGKLIGTIGHEDGARPELSPDGKRVAVDREIDGNLDVWVLDATTGASNKLTIDPAIDAVPIFSPDSKRVVFQTEKGHVRRQDLYSKSADGTGEATLLVAALDGNWTQTANAWSPDGRFLLFQRRSPDGVYSLYALALTVDGKPEGEPFALAKPNSNANERDACFSLDSHWIAYESNQSGKNEIYVKPFPGPGPAKQISIGGGTQVRWPRTAQELFYVGPDGKLIARPVSTAADGHTLVPGMPAVVAPNLRVRTGVLRHEYDISPEGQRILMSAIPEDKLTPPISLIFNWKPPSK